MRLPLVALLVACGKRPSEPPPAAVPEPRIVVGESKGVVEGATRGLRDPDPMFQLKPDEGTLSVGRLEGTAGTAGTAEVSLAPATGFKVATNFKIKLELEAPPGVKLAKTLLTAGGVNEVRGDATTLSQKQLAFSVQATPEAPGSYEIKGVFSFGVCQDDSCRPRAQPFTIHVAAN